MDVNRFQKAVSEAQKILADNPDGGVNEVAKRQLIDACNAMEWSLNEGDYYIEKICDIRRAASNFYSARKNLKFKQGFSSGIQVLRLEISSWLNRIEKYSEELQTTKRKNI